MLKFAMHCYGVFIPLVKQGRSHSKSRASQEWSIGQQPLTVDSWAKVLQWLHSQVSRCKTISSQYHSSGWRGEETIEEESSLCPTSSSPVTKELYISGQDKSRTSQDLSVSAYAVRFLVWTKYKIFTWDEIVESRRKKPILRFCLNCLCSFWVE